VRASPGPGLLIHHADLLGHADRGRVVLIDRRLRPRERSLGEVAPHLGVGVEIRQRVEVRGDEPAQDEALGLEDKSGF
jgi:hypothetical protein